MLVLHPGTDIGSPSPCWVKETQTVFVHVPMMIGIEVSYNPGIPASMGNPVSYVQVGGSDSMSSTPSG